MDKAGLIGFRIGLLQLFAQEVLNSFDVVIRRRLDVFDALGVFEREVCRQTLHTVTLYLGQRTAVWYVIAVSQILEPAQFY